MERRLIQPGDLDQNGIPYSDEEREGWNAMALDADAHPDETGDFVPTHTILLDNGRQFFMLIPDERGDGPLYDEEEWDFAGTADWEIVNGEFLFQGAPYPGRHEVEIWVVNA